MLKTSPSRFLKLQESPPVWTQERIPTAAYQVLHMLPRAGGTYPGKGGGGGYCPGVDIRGR